MSQEWLNFQTWAIAHPVLMGLIVWPFVLAVFTWAFKARTPEEYERIATKYGPRIAALAKLAGSLGIDPRKAEEALRQIVTGTYVPAPMMARAVPPPPASTLDLEDTLKVLPLVLAVGLLGATSTGCASAKPIAKSAGELADAACVIAKADLPTSQAVADYCHIEHELVPVIDTVLAAHRAQLAAHGVVLRPLADGGAQ